MKEISVFEGNELKESAPTAKVLSPRINLKGSGSTHEGIGIALDDDLLSKHILFLGGIGSGKTNAIFQIVDQLRSSIGKHDVLLIFDSKGDFYDKFYREGDIVISNDENATGPRGTDYWNIFSDLDYGGRIEEEIAETSASLFIERKERSQQPFFPNAAADLLASILLHFVRNSKSIPNNNSTLREFFDNANPAIIRETLLQHSDLMAIASYIENDKSGQTQGVISELQQLVREIFVGNFRKSGSLSMREILRKKGAQTVFVEYDLTLGSTLSPIYRILLDTAIKEALGRRSFGNVWFILDEFRLIPKLRHIDDGVNFGRSLGAKFVVGIQNVEQVFHAFGEPLARSILSGFQTTIAFRVSDSATRQYIQGLYGKNRKKEIFVSSVQSRGVIENIREGNVVEDWDILNLKIGEGIIGLPNAQPFLFQFSKFNK